MGITQHLAIHIQQQPTAELEFGPVIFNVVFFVVLVSALTQGWSLPLVARRLALVVPSEPEPAVTLEITSLRHVDGDIVEYTVSPDCRAANRLVRELSLPDGVVISMIAREQRIIPPRGSTRVLPGDHVFLVMRPGVRPLVNRVFGPGGATVNARMTLATLELSITPAAKYRSKSWGSLSVPPGAGAWATT